MKVPKSTTISWVLLCVFLSQMTVEKTVDLSSSNSDAKNNAIGKSLAQRHRNILSNIDGRILAKQKFQEKEEEVADEEPQETGVIRSDSREGAKPEDEDTPENAATKTDSEKEREANLAGEELVKENIETNEKEKTKKKAKEESNEPNKESGRKSKRKSKRKHGKKSKPKEKNQNNDQPSEVPKEQGKQVKPEVEAVDGAAAPQEVPLPTNFPNLNLIISESRIRSCNINLINAFNMIGLKVAQPEESEANLLKYCPKNRWTCCHHWHVESSRSYFAKGQKSFKHMFRMIEEMLTLFRGKMHKHIFRDMANQKECHYVLEEYESIKSAEEFFSDSYAEIQLKEIQNLLNELPTYVRSELTFFGSIICTICDAHDNLSFSVQENQTKIFAHPDTCNSIIDNSQFVINFTYLFFEFIEPLTKVIKCARNLNDDVKYASSSSSLKPLIKFEKHVEDCKKSQNKNIAACQKVCNRSIHKYELIRPLTKSNIRAALRVLFYEFMEIEADEFEWQTRKSKLDDPQFETINFFNPLDYDFRNFRIDKPDWYFHEKGSRILYNTMASHYFTIEGIQRLFGSALVFILSAMIML